MYLSKHVTLTLACHLRKEVHGIALLVLKIKFVILILLAALPLGSPSLGSQGCCLFSDGLVACCHLPGPETPHPVSRFDLAVRC